MRNLLIVFTTTLLLSVSAFASTGNAEIKVSWQNPEKFTDIRPGSGTKKAYQKRVITAFDKIWADLAAKLPAGYSLEVVVTDLDLAGDVEPLFHINGAASGASDIRVVKDIYFPKMTLDYVLYDQTKTEVGRASGVKIKDMGFMQSGNIGLKNREFAYEQLMLEKWFDKVLIPQLNSAKTR